MLDLIFKNEANSKFLTDRANYHADFSNYTDEDFDKKETFLSTEGYITTEDKGRFQHYVLTPFGSAQYFKEKAINEEQRNESGLELKIKELTRESLEREKESSSLAAELQSAQLKLTTLHIKEAKKKKLYAIVGFISGAIISHVKEILELLRKLLHQ